MIKDIYQGFEVLENVLKGAGKASKLITSTMGPGGHLVCIPNKYKSRFTKDGATVAQNLDEIKDPVESIGAKLITQASKDMSDRVGDGSTTVVCLLYKMMKTSVNLMRSGFKPFEIVNAMNIFKKSVFETIESIHQKIDVNSEKMTQIATIAANGDQKIGQLLAEMFGKLGKEGAIIAEESITGETYTDIKEGFYFNKGAQSTMFFKPEEQERMKIELDSPLILAVNQKLTGLQPLLPVIQHVSQMGKPLLIVAEDVENDIINTLAFNRTIGKLNAVIVKADGFGDRKISFIEDLAIFTGATIVGESYNNFHNMDITVCGSAKKVQITKDNTTIIGGNGQPDHKEKRIKIIEQSILTATSQYDKEKLQERLSKLVSGIGTIYVGGQTELEIKESKDRVEDAIHACKNALKGGIVPGAGTELMYAGFLLSNHENPIVRNFANVLEKPVRKIVKNVNRGSADVVLEELKQHFQNNHYNMGFNGITGKITDVINDGIINPKLVSINALMISLSNCEQFIKLNAVVVESKEDTKTTSYNNEDIYR